MTKVHNLRCNFHFNYMEVMVSALLIDWPLNSRVVESIVATPRRKSKVLSGVCFEHYVLHISSSIPSEDSSSFRFFIYQDLYLTLRVTLHCLQINFFVDAIGFLKFLTRISVLSRCKGRWDRNNEEKYCENRGITLWLFEQQISIWFL